MLKDCRRPGHTTVYWRQREKVGLSIWPVSRVWHSFNPDRFQVVYYLFGFNMQIWKKLPIGVFSLGVVYSDSGKSHFGSCPVFRSDLMNILFYKPPEDTLTLTSVVWAKL